MALMPVAGDVDCVVASELAEAGRAVARGLVSGQTTLIASTHRAYTIAEKSALGDGTSDAQQLLELVRGQGRRAIVFDMEATAQRHGSVISAVLLGAISGAAVLPFAKEAYAAAISGSGLAVDTNLAAFEDAHRLAEGGGRPETVQHAAGLPPVPERARTAALQPLLERVRPCHRRYSPGHWKACVARWTIRTRTTHSFTWHASNGSPRSIAATSSSPAMRSRRPPRAAWHCG